MATNYLTNDTDLKTVADAIRSKGDTSAALVYPDGFKSAIAALPEPKEEQTKTVTPTVDGVTVEPDSGKVLSKVTVSAIPTATQATPSISVSGLGLITASATQSAGYVSAGTKSATLQLDKQAGKFITPTTSQQTAVTSGKYTTGSIYVNGDTNLVSGNIKNGVSIFGVEGTFAPTPSETWVLNETIDRSTIVSENPIYISYISNEQTFQLIYIGDGLLSYVTDDEALDVYEGGGAAGWLDQAYRKVTFTTAPTGDLLTWLESNATKQASDTAIQPSKERTIISNGTITVRPDSPYDAIGEVSVTVNVSGGFPNGTKWTQSNITSGSFSSLYNANGVWVAGSNYGKGLYYSTDGQTWTQSNITSGGFSSVVNANGLWVAISRETGSGKGIYYSTDGQTWTRSNITSGVFSSVVNANGLWVAGGAYSGTSYTGFYYSTDGKTWTQSNITSDGSGSVVNANGLWVAGSSSSSRGLYYSTDGKTWTQSNITSGGFPSSVVNANGLWVAGSNYGKGLYYSTDGQTWTQSNITSGSFSSLYNANGVWVAGSNYGKGLYYSTDGQTWTQSNITSGSFSSLYNANGVWVAGSSSSKGLYYSVSWEPS